MNKCLCIRLLSLLGIFTSLVLLGFVIDLFSASWETATPIPIVSIQVCKMNKCSPFPTSFLAWAAICYWSWLVWQVWWNVKAGLNCISLTAEDVEHFHNQPFVFHLLRSLLTSLPHFNKVICFLGDSTICVLFWKAFTVIMNSGKFSLSILSD